MKSQFRLISSQQRRVFCRLEGKFLVWNTLICACHKSRCPDLLFVLFNKTLYESNWLAFFLRADSSFILSCFKLSIDLSLVCILPALDNFRRYMSWYLIFFLSICLWIKDVFCNERLDVQASILILKLVVILCLRRQF